MTPVSTERLLAPATTPTITSAVIVTAPAPQPARRRVGVSPGVLVIACVFLGLAFRVGVYLRNPSLWLDESMLAVNVVNRTPLQLLEPLELNQGAPLGFLLTSRAIVAAFGPSELALRAIPAFASLAGFLLFVGFAYRVLSVPAARLAVVLFAFSPYLVGYAAEFKQYELDATLTVALLLIGRRIWEGTSTRHEHVLMAIGGAVAVWFSHPAVFVLGGVGSALLADAIVRRDRPAMKRNGLIIFAWLVSFAACYLLFLRKLGLNPYLTDFWAGKFLPLPPVRPGDFAWIVHHVVLLFDKPGGFGGEIGMAGLAAVCAIIGGVSLAKSNWRLLVALAAPLAFALAASALRKYPFAGRLMLFAVPSLLVLVAHGTMAVADRVRDLGTFARWLVIAAVCAGPANECNNLRKTPLHAEGAREVLVELAKQWQPGDRVYVAHEAIPAFRYYGVPVPADVVTFGGDNRANLRHYREDLHAISETGRLWVVMAHFQPQDEATVLAVLDCLGAGEVTARRPDAVLMRCEVRPR
ncbi:hypothetical protein [Limnoglobus roseus]|uniref:Glycosyltransferase RgtA/B/C/D-like domain-containing protein n=1 Tax=Limnoglobus roseus TaxID=2598579 RepID=A0A5C1ACV7_9BACT|nr:hypothetical protein [Limnoglobus roseus]QEL16043.1 hypothetical protein PX52LOC_02981 [Limnoglobus roseus]